VLVRAALLLEVLLLLPPGPHPGQFAEGKRVAADEAKFATDEIDIYRILPWLISETTSRYRGVSKKWKTHNHGNRHFSCCSDSGGSVDYANIDHTGMQRSANSLHEPPATLCSV